MKLKVGDLAPDFQVAARQAGQDRALALSELIKQGEVVLYFYPRDFTTVCTKESCGFRDMYVDLQTVGAEVIGVSVDDAQQHDRFAREHAIGFPLVSDPRRELARLYGATSLVRDLMGVTLRVTFVIDRSGRVIGRFDSELQASLHLEGVRRALLGARGQPSH